LKNDSITVTSYSSTQRIKQSLIGMLFILSKY
jgi:hypothetical protein